MAEIELEGFPCTKPGPLKDPCPACGARLEERGCRRADRRGALTERARILALLDARKRTKTVIRGGMKVSHAVKFDQGWNECLSTIRAAITAPNWGGEGRDAG